MMIKIVVFVPPEIWNTVKKLPVEEKGKWRVRKDEENTYFLSESLQSSSLDSEAFNYLKVLQTMMIFKYPTSKKN